MDATRLPPPPLEFIVVMAPPANDGWNRFLSSGSIIGRNGFAATWDPLPRLVPFSIDDNTTSPIESPIDGVSYDVCVGTSPLGCQVQPFLPAQQTGRYDVNAAVFSQLKCGTTYYIAVQATNCAGLQTTIFSPGGRVCCYAPTAGSVLLSSGGFFSKALPPTVLTGFDGSGTYEISDYRSLSISWSGFADACSGIYAYTVDLIEVESGNFTHSWTVTEADDKGIAFDPQVERKALAWSTVLPSAVVQGLQELTYEVRVTAMNHVGLTVAASAQFKSDFSAPTVGAVFSGDGANAPCIREGQPLKLSWSDIDDSQSSVANIEWAVGSYSDVTAWRPFTDVGSHFRSGGHSWPAFGAVAEVGMVVYSNVRVTDLAGNTVVATSPAVRVVPPDCNTSLVCLPATPSTSATSATTPSATHPLFFPLLLGFAGWSSYKVESHSTIPSMGEIKSSLTVHVAAGSADRAGRRLVELRTEPNGGSVEVAGKEHKLVELNELHSLHTHPIFYWQEADGVISEVLHHPEEEQRPLQEKRALMRYLQLPSTTSEKPTFERDEQDVNGMVRARYHARRGLLRRLVVQKNVAWHSSSTALRQTGNPTPPHPIPSHRTLAPPHPTPPHLANPPHHRPHSHPIPPHPPPTLTPTLTPNPAPSPTHSHPPTHPPSTTPPHPTPPNPPPPHPTPPRNRL